MKRTSYFILFLCLAFFLVSYHSAEATVFKWIKVNKTWTMVMDSGDQSESTLAKRVYYYYDDFVRSTGWCGRGWSIIAKDWTDPAGTLWPFKATGAGEVGPANELQNLMPVPDKNGITTHRYFRYKPARIIIDGYSMEDKSDLPGDEVNAGKTSTADVMVESYANTYMGISVRMREFGWNHGGMDEFTIQDWTFYNTGNVNLDDKIELPNQTIKDAYFWVTGQIHDNHNPWCIYYGNYTKDSMRISYTYPARRQAATYDNLGYSNTMPTTGWLDRPMYLAFSVLHMDKSPKEHVDDPSQPIMTGYTRMEWPWYRIDRLAMPATDLQSMYQCCTESLYPLDGLILNKDPGQYPGALHSMDMDRLGLVWRDEAMYKQGYGQNLYAAGPYTFAPGDSLRIVRAWLMSGISPEKGWEVGTAWKAKQRTWTGAYNFAQCLIAHPEQAPADYDKDKDMWIFTGKDSLFNQNWAAQFAVRNKYKIPIPPDPPSVNVKSQSDKILVEWGSESETASDFAGYRVYRAQGNPGGKIVSGLFVGTWSLEFECGKGTANPLTHSYSDTKAERGQAYYYYVSAFDDGVSNLPNEHGVVKSYQTGPYVNRTTRAAYLTKPAGTLSTIRVVPNPYNKAASTMQFKGEPDKIMFMGLPPVCTIKIYSESMDLVREINHTNGSGDEAWGTQTNEFSTSKTGQIIVSGIYLAYIETPSGESTFVKFLVIR